MCQYIGVRKAFWIILLGLWFGQPHFASCAESRTGQVVWWGQDAFWKKSFSAHTNGVIESGGEILNDVVGIAAQHSQALLLKSDGTVFSCGLNMYEGGNVPAGLSNVASVAAEGSSFWAIRRDGTVARWGSDEDNENIVTGLSNITAITWAGYRSYFALKSDGTVLGFRFDTPGAGASIDPATGLPTPIAERTSLRLVKVGGQILSNVVAMASMGDSPLVLRSDGKVMSLGRQIGGASAYSVRPYHYASAVLVTLDGLILNDVTALASGGGHCLALTSNGTVVAWGSNHYGESAVPDDLSNVVAIAAAEGLSLALKRDGTVAAWGGNYFGQTSVPAGLSNAVASAAGGWFSLALTTGAVPASVYIRPHGRLEEVARKADLIFKGRAASSVAITNDFFPSWGKPRATQLEAISVLQGSTQAKTVTFLHITGQPNAWSGGTPPSHFTFETGQSYVVFAVQADKPDWLYSPSSNSVAKPDEFRQPMHGEFAIRTLDTRPLTGLSIKEAHWLELNLLLNDTNPTNELYAIDKLDHLSLVGRRDDEWSRSSDFKRAAVLRAMLPLVTSDNEQVANRAMSCFAAETNIAPSLEPFIGTLTKVANESSSPSCRLSAIAALSGVNDQAVSNSLSQLLKNPDENIRLGAVRLLPRFPDEFAEQGLRELAEDKSANVRSVVADVIGDRKYVRVLPTLVKLFADPVGKDPLIKPMTMEYLKAGQRWSNIGDVHTSAGLALVKFAPDQVADILKTNLDDPGFHINFVAKLAQKNAEPWLPELVSILEARIAYVEDIAKFPPLDPKRFSAPGVNNKILVGAYTKCWEDIRQYLLKKSPKELSSGKYDRYMDLLEKTVRPVAGCPGCCVQEARWLYELYWTKGTAKRVGNLRRQYDKTDGWWFDDFNKGIRGEADPVNPISF